MLANSNFVVENISSEISEKSLIQSIHSLEFPATKRNKPVIGKYIVFNFNILFYFAPLQDLYHIMSYSRGSQKTIRDLFGDYNYII